MGKKHWTEYLALQIHMYIQVTYLLARLLVSLALQDDKEKLLKTEGLIELRHSVLK